MLFKTSLTVLSFTLFLLSASFAQTTKSESAAKEELAGELKAAPCKNSKRLEAARALFVTMGATEADISISKYGDVKDLVVTKKGKTDETIIVGAHYDKVEAGCGAIDNWTGVVTIANIYRAFRAIETEKTYLFVAFDREESGLFGSHAMAKAISKEERPKYCAMVNIDSLGMADPQVMDNTSTIKMRDAADAMAKELQIKLAHAGIADADADSSSFKDKGIPAITFHGLNSDWKRFLHTPNDKFQNINIDSLLKGYGFVALFITRIDTLGCSEFRK